VGPNGERLQREPHEIANSPGNEVRYLALAFDVANIVLKVEGPGYHLTFSSTGAGSRIKTVVRPRCGFDLTVALSETAAGSWPHAQLGD